MHTAVNYFLTHGNFLFTILYPLQFLSFVIVYATLFRIIVQVVRRDFRYYFAKSCFRISVENHDKIQSMRYLIEGLNSYDKYLKRRFDFQIKDLMDVQQKIAFTDPHVKDKLLKSLSEETSNKLDLIGKLSDFLYLIYPEDLLEVQQFKVKIAQTIPIVAAVIIPIIVAIIQLYAAAIGHK
jgi:hypothetical protein